MKIRIAAVAAVVVSSLLLSACAANPLDSGADKIIVSGDKPAKGCRFIGQVNGSQGNFFTGGWTSNKNIQMGAMNSIRNSAAKMRANYVQLVNSNASAVGNNGSGQQVGMQFLGNAYWCPPAQIGLS
jgi:hypothetical protein